MIILTILYVHILCRKYEEEIRTGICPSSRKHTLQDLNIGDGYFPKFDVWIEDAINDTRQEGQDITIEEIDLS
jgi:hypothetical protein